MRAKLTIHREAYCRKPFTRSSGVKVAASCSPATTFKIIDIGAVGKGRRLFKVKKGLLKRYGYKTHESAQARHKALKKADKAYGSVRLWRMLNAQAIFRKRLADGNKETFIEDRDWVRENFINRQEARSMTKPAVSAWKGMSHYKRVLARAGV